MGVFQVAANIKELGKKKKVRNAVTLAAVVLSALLQSFVIQVFIRPAGLLSGGFTGIAILIDMVTSLFGHSFSTSLGMLALNIPVALLCSRSISLRFTVFSLIQVACSSLFLQIFHFTPMFDDIMLNVIFGGFLLGTSIVIALKGNASTGGDGLYRPLCVKQDRTVYLDLGFCGKCGAVLYFWTDLRMDGSRLLYHLPVHQHKDHLLLPSQVREGDAPDHDGKGRAGDEGLCGTVPSWNILCGGCRRLQRAEDVRPPYRCVCL